MMNSKKTGIVDVIVFYEPYGVELLEFRIKLLEHYVDWFIVTEADRTQTGEPIDFKFEEVAERLHLPMNNIIYVKQHIPEDSQLEIKAVDLYNIPTWNRTNVELQRNRVRERMQKDAMLQVVDEFDDDTVFIIGDSDEIVRPDAVSWLSKLCINNPNVIMRIPLRHMQGRADLEVYDETTGNPVGWNGNLYFAQKHHLRDYTPLEIRSWLSNQTYPIVWPTHESESCENLGWHFSWMGNSKHRLKKRKSFIHANEKMHNSVFDNNGSEEYTDLLKNGVVRDGAFAPDGVKNHILRKIDLEELPDTMFMKREFIEFFFSLD